MAVELTADQILERRAKDAERKREERKVAREKKLKLAAEKKANEAKSFPEYWAQQRANLTEAQRAEYEQRESDVLDLQFAMEKYIAGNYDDATDVDDRVPLEAIIEEVQLEVKTHGICESIILVVPNLWTEQEKDLRERIAAKGGATATLLQYGYRTALEGFLYERFYQKFLMPRTEIPQSFTTITCLCGATSSISVEVARLYAARIFRCGRCIAKDNAGKVELAKSLAKEYGQDQSQIYDGWGRIRL